MYTTTHTKQEFIRALEWAKYDFGLQIIRNGEFKIELERVPDGPWNGCIISAREKALDRLIKRVKRSSAKLFKVKKEEQ